MKMLKNFYLTLLVAVSLAACSPEVADNTGAETGRVGSIIEAANGRMMDRAAIRSGGAQVSDGTFLASTRVQSTNASRIPARLRGPNAVSLISRDPLTLSEISQRLTEVTSVPHIPALGPTGQVTVVSDSIGVDSDSTSLGGVGAMETRANASASRITTGGDTSQSGSMRMRPNVRGSLEEVLNEVALAFEVEWRFEDDRILFRDYVTRQYQISALPSTSSTASTVGSASSELSLDIYSEIESTLQSIAGDGSSISIGSGTGLITVTARVRDHGRIEEYVTDLNASLNQQIAFDINVLTVSLNESSEFGLDLNFLFDSLGNASSAATSNAGVGSVNIGIAGGAINVDVLANALSSQGSVSVDTRTGATTSNNRIVPVLVADQVSYVASVNVQTDDAGNQTFIPQPATETIGFELQLFPRILNNRDIMVEYAVQLTDLNDLRTFGSGSTAVEVPNVSQTAFSQQALLSNGQTLVLAGFERNRARSSEQRSNGILGLDDSFENERVSTILMITPRILNRNPR